MVVRARVRVVIALIAAALIAAALSSVASSPAAATRASEAGQSGRVAVAAPGGTPSARTADSRRSRAGEKAGRKAGAVAGAKAGRRMGARLGEKGAVVGEAAGRKWGAIAGARAGRKAGVRGGAKAGSKAGAKAGASAGALAGSRAAAALPPDCGTATYRRPDGSVYRCVFSDDFNGTTLNSSKWRVMTSDEFNFGDRYDCFLPGAGNVSVADGMLTLTARKEASMFNCGSGRNASRTQYSAGMVSTYEKYSQTYGRFEFRARFPFTTQRGLQTSLWLWPEGATGANWPVSGEIDVAEWYSQYADRVVPYLHYAGLGGAQATNNQCLVDNVGAWHTYVLDWQPRYISISYDGKECLRNTSTGAPFNKPYLMAMFNAFGLRKNGPQAGTPALSKAQIAWVRTWS